MSAVNFLVELLVKAGISRQLALALAQAYLSRHGIPFDLAAAVEQILEELARGGGGVTAVGGVTVVEGGSAAAVGGIAPPATGSSALDQILAEILAEQSKGTVSSQAITSHELTFAEALGLVTYQVGSQAGDAYAIDQETYEDLGQQGLLDAPDLV